MSYKDFIKSRTNESIVEPTPTKDWEKEVITETINPEYNDNNKDYNISLRDVIKGINNSRHKLSGTNVWLPDEDGNLLPLPDWIGSVPGGGGGGGAHETKQYKLEMLSSQGNIIKDKNFQTTLRAVLYENNEDVTALKDAKYFKWARFSGATEKDQIADAEWNLKWANGAKEIPITHDDVNRNAMFQVQFVTEQESQIWVKEAYKAYMTLKK